MSWTMEVTGQDGYEHWNQLQTLEPQKGCIVSNCQANLTRNSKDRFWHSYSRAISPPLLLTDTSRAWNLWMLMLDKPKQGWILTLDKWLCKIGKGLYRLQFIRGRTIDKGWILTLPQILRTISPPLPLLILA